MKKILIIHSGGTIGMTKTEKGYSPDGPALKAALEQMDALKTDPVPLWDFTETDPLLDSSRMSVSDWNRIGEAVAEHYDAYDGFVILHGTDTMAYTASALSFMFSGLDKPVILTGSQIPLFEARTDGRDNLITSMIIAGEGRVREVCIYFGGRLLRGNRATKFSADGMQAFISPNYPNLAEAGIRIVYNESVMDRKNAEKDAVRGGSDSLPPFSFVPLKDVPIGVFKVFPGIPFEVFSSLIADPLKGIVIEAFGSGNVPDSPAVLSLIEKARRTGTVLTVCSQCPQATVNMNAYEAGHALAAAGAVSGGDMTTEAAVAKLYYLFTVSDDTEEIRKMMEMDLRGERR
ncbi:MAG: type I asparaginase [Lachnospiraceae bacterium]|nr:type I asparaginase [Lachnospiraceae bacterium]